MLIGVAESLVARGALDLEHLAQTLLQNYEPARGYGRGMKRFFQALDRGDSLDEASQATWSQGSFGNGAAVRVAPLACLLHRDLERLVREVAESARLTHRHPLAIAATVAQATTIGHILRVEELDTEQLFRELKTVVPDETREFVPRLERVEQLLKRGGTDLEAASVLGNGVSSLESVPLSLFAFLRHSDDFGEAVLAAISLGGDTDSIGAMTGALAGAQHGIEHIPSEWLLALENRHRGRDHLEALADALTEQSVALHRS
jgi:poly(ADP-ribose) glycohydrolase ARH3